ncbi:MAG: chemotaxis response regulator protein-glutamate methylesterase [Oligoflexia bacterium]|nr:chemotaxis response regulator protein-glutamate methylesterase [Oligoflexia bacterium]
MRILVADDSALFRNLIAKAITEIPNVELIAVAVDGKQALEKILLLKPDLVTLDIEMPELSGIEVLRQLKQQQQQLETGVIMVSTHTREGGALTIEALGLGAFDFITKPTLSTAEANLLKIKEDISRVIKAYTHKVQIKKILEKQGTNKKSPPLVNRPPKCQLIAIGISTGGPHALAEFLPLLPGDLNVPILIVQHMPPLFTESLAKGLDQKCKLRVKEAADGDLVLPNKIYIAPGGKQMKMVTNAANNFCLRICDDPPENNCRPAVDYLFRSLAHNHSAPVLALIMTGMGSDGVLGLKLLKRHGHFVIAQDEASCVVFGMPKEAMSAGVVDATHALADFPAVITKIIRGYP